MREKVATAVVIVGVALACLLGVTYGAGALMAALVGLVLLAVALDLWAMS